MESETQTAVMQRWFSCDELAIRFGVNRSTIWKWTEQGVLPKPGILGDRLTRWPLEEVLALEEVLKNGGRVRGKKADMKNQPQR